MSGRAYRSIVEICGAVPEALPRVVWLGSAEVRPHYRRTPLEALLARSDAPAHEYLADRLLSEEPIDVDVAPGPAEARAIDDDKAEAG